MKKRRSKEEMDEGKGAAGEGLVRRRRRRDGQGRKSRWGEEREGGEGRTVSPKREIELRLCWSDSLEFTAG